MTNHSPSLIRSVKRNKGERGVASLILVCMLLMAILMALAISNWISIQRRGDLQMRVSMKEAMLAQSAIGETRFRLLKGLIPNTCVPGVPQEFTYFIEGSTVTVRIDCAPFP